MYIVIEPQTNEETVTIVNTYTNRDTTVMLSAEGYYIKSEFYTHEVEE